MSIYKMSRRFFYSINIQLLYIIGCVILVFTLLVSCSGKGPGGVNENSNEFLSEVELGENESDEIEQLAKTEISPTLETVKEEGKIAFMTTRDGNAEIYLMDVDGGNQINLTNNNADDYYPTWSPDGNRIAFVSYRDSEYENTGDWVPEIYILNIDGSNPVRLTNNDINEGSISWSPDGEKFVFTADWDKVRYENPLINWKGVEIGVMDADGSNLIRLTTNAFRDDSPAWSPDGSKIVFASDRDGYGNKKVFPLDGDSGNSNSVNLPKGPDYRSYVDLVGDREIYVMELDGGNVVRLTNDNWSNSMPAWSPDGKKIAFVSERDEIAIICLMNADGSNETCLQNSDVFKHAHSPAWSPDGSKIVFSTNGNAVKEIYVMNANGVVLSRIVDSGVNYLPVWQP